MKRLILLILSALLLCGLLLTVAGCEKSEKKEPNTDNSTNSEETVADAQASEGLEYELNEDGESYSVIGIGSCTDANLVFPSEHDGKPVTGIQTDAFVDCDFITAITIPNTVTKLYEESTNFYVKLTKTYIVGEEEINLSLFSQCKSLTAITVAEGNPVYHSKNNCLIETATNTLISGCKTSVIPDDGSVTRIGYTAFWCCESLTSITIPDNVTNIDVGAFWGCNSLADIMIPNSVTNIGNCAFFGCNNFTNLTIPDSVISIGEYAFNECNNLASITIPDSVTSIGWAAFCGTVYYNDDANWIDGVLYIGKCLIGAKNSISDSYAIKDGTRCITDGAFGGCSSLASIIIPDSVTSIGSSVFSGCSSLASIIIPNSVTSIGSSAFSGCSSLASIIIPDSVTSIGSSVFSGCSSLASIIIPNSVTSIGGYAFSGCRSLTTITVPKKVTSIGIAAFAGCDGLETVIVAEGNVEYHANGNCLIHTADKILIAGFQNSIIPTDGSVTSIGAGAFYECSGLKSITIPDSVTSIGEGAFYGCNSLTSIKIPDGVTSIGSSAFSECSNLTGITIPNSVTSISDRMFAGCGNLTGIIIPGSVTSVGNGAFLSCTSLKSIQFSGTTAQWEAVSKGNNWNSDTGSYVVYYIER